jgi:hypothetical protein
VGVGSGKWGDGSGKGKEGGSPSTIPKAMFSKHFSHKVWVLSIDVPHYSDCILQIFNHKFLRWHNTINNMFKPEISGVLVRNVF